MIVTYRVEGRFTRRYSPFRGFTGFAVRGLFGYALRRLICVRPDLARCADCEYYGKCVYSRMVEATPDVRPSGRVAQGPISASRPKDTSTLSNSAASLLSAPLRSQGSWALTLPAGPPCTRPSSRRPRGPRPAQRL